MTTTKTTIADAELLPCPFCGMPARISERRRGIAVVHCDNPTTCAVHPGTGRFIEHVAVEYWNRRFHTNPPSEERIEQVARLVAKWRADIQRTLDHVPAFAAETGMSQDEAAGREYAWSYALAWMDELEAQFGATAALEAADGGMREALVKCRDKFREYAQLHAAKLNDGLPDREFNEIMRKSDRNREMADMCDAALAKQEPR